VDDLGWLDDVAAGGGDVVNDDYGPCVCGEHHHNERHQQCPRCLELFNGTTIADVHLVKKHPPDGYVPGGVGRYQLCPCQKGQSYCHYCLNTDTMRERGWWQDDLRVWHQPAPVTDWRAENGEKVEPRPVH